MTASTASIRPRPALGRLAALGLALSLGAGNPALAAENGGNPWDFCAAQTARAEQAHGVPGHLLTAISKVESGRWRAETQENLAWPWTVTAGGEGRFLPSKAAAIAEVKRLKAAGLTNIDVGCMQVNLRYHPKAFEDLETAFDPARNADYAARFLSNLREDWGSWPRAVGNYHSNTPHLSGPYRVKVFRTWQAERRRARQARSVTVSTPPVQVSRSLPAARSAVRTGTGNLRRLLRTRR
jgi:soluble lytic murein transglycosylase-like protein